jgi:hypothetical protein
MVKWWDDFFRVTSGIGSISKAQSYLFGLPTEDKISKILDVLFKVGDGRIDSGNKVDSKDFMEKLLKKIPKDEQLLVSEMDWMRLVQTVNCLCEWVKDKNPSKEDLQELFFGRKDKVTTRSLWKNITRQCLFRMNKGDSDVAKRVLCGLFVIHRRAKDLDIDWAYDGDKKATINATIKNEYLTGFKGAMKEEDEDEDEVTDNDLVRNNLPLLSVLKGIYAGESPEKTEARVSSIATATLKSCPKGDKAVIIVTPGKPTLVNTLKKTGDGDGDEIGSSWFCDHLQTWDADQSLFQLIPFVYAGGILGSDIQVRYSLFLRRFLDENKKGIDSEVSNSMTTILANHIHEIFNTRIQLAKKTADSKILQDEKNVLEDQEKGYENDYLDKNQARWDFSASASDTNASDKEKQLLIKGITNTSVWIADSHCPFIKLKNSKGEVHCEVILFQFLIN